jgi:hypothetical protein
MQNVMKTLILVNSHSCLCAFVLGIMICFAGQAQTVQDTLTKKEIRQKKKQLKVEQGKPLVTPLAGPAYTPELGFTIAGTVMLSYKTNPRDSHFDRCDLPFVHRFLLLVPGQT